MFRHLSVIVVTAAGLLLPVRADADPKAVVELFTSQGCASCVPADEYLSELAKRDDVLALSYHVDYWDYLGWRDTFGNPDHSERQRDYAETLGGRRIYTPQMVVNGMSGVVGSDREAVEKEIAQSTLPLPVSMWWHEGTVVIKVPALPIPGQWPMTIWLVLFSAEAEVAISQGENAGETIGYRNVVRDMRPIGMWDGSEVRITLPADELMGEEADGCAVLVQEDLSEGPGRVMGAAQLESW